MNPRSIRLTNNSSDDGTSSLRRHRPDYVLIIVSAILLVVGLITIYAISPGLTASNNVSGSYYVEKQLIAIALGLAGFFVVTFLPIEFWRKYIKQLVVLSIIASIAVRLFGQKINGAYRWVQVGGFSFQAVELIKFTLLIWLAVFLTQRIKESNLTNSKYTLKPLLIAITLIGIVVAGIQSDLGSTGVMIMMIITMCFVAGLPLKRFAIIAGIVGIGLVLAISSSSYRRDRLLTFLHPTQNCQTTQTGYQACQALIAVGSGGLFGKGLAHSVQDYGYLPETNNDSIFAVYAEQFGFVGVVVLLILFLALFKRIKSIMEKAPNNFSRFVVAGVLAWIAGQTLINVGAMIGLLPLKGITLPLISYGGTSIVFVLIAIGLVFNVSYYTVGRSTELKDDIRGIDNEDSALRRRNRRPHNAYLSNRT